MNFFYENYCQKKETGISKKEWEQFGYESLVKLFLFLDVKTEKNLFELANFFTYKEFKRGEQLMHFNDQEKTLFYIISGTVKFYILQSGKEIVKALVNEGNFATSLTILTQKKAGINIETCSKLRVLAIRESTISRLMSAGWIQEISRIIIASHSRGGIFIQKLSLMLHHDNLEKIKILQREFPLMFQQFSAKNIASLLAMKPSTYSTLRAQI